MKIKLFVIAILASVFALTPLAKADSITLESHNGNNYNYGITFDETTTIFFLEGFQLTGLSGVTNAVLSGDLADDFGVLGFNSTSVSIGTFFASEHKRHTPFTVGTLTVTSAAAPGNVNFQLSDSNGDFSGIVTGPVGGSSPSPVPEPSSIVLLGSGLLAAAGAVRRKLLA